IKNTVFLPSHVVNDQAQVIKNSYTFYTNERSLINLRFAPASATRIGNFWKSLEIPGADSIGIHSGPASEDRPLRCFRFVPLPCSCFPSEIMLTETLLQGTFQECVQVINWSVASSSVCRQFVVR
ncbi:hypothetical protein THAOC_04598, partial [Thalassiosira oceanica]